MTSYVICSLLNFYKNKSVNNNTSCGFIGLMCWALLDSDFHTSKILHVYLWALEDFVPFRLKGSSCVPLFLISVNVLIFLSGSQIGLFSKMSHSFLQKSCACLSVRLFRIRSSNAANLLWWEKEERDISTLTVAKIDPVAAWKHQSYVFQHNDWIQNARKVWGILLMFTNSWENQYTCNTHKLNSLQLIVS